jgi:hypothetical protein
VDLADMGIHLVSVEDVDPDTDGNPTAVHLRVDVGPLTAALARFSAACTELDAAWQALPPAARETVGDSTITLRAKVDG